MKVKIKKIDKNAVIPSYAKDGDAGMDLTTIGYSISRDKPYIEYSTGLSIEIPDGYVGLIYPRSSVSKTPYYLANSVGVIDSGYRGEVKVRFKVDMSIIAAEEEGMKLEQYKEGDRIAQLIIVPYPKVEFEEVEELDKTDRGEGGFGSTNGNNKNKTP